MPLGKKRNGEGFFHADYLFFLLGECWGPILTDYLIDAGPENFRLVELDYIYGSGWNSSWVRYLLLESWALTQVTPLGASGFFFNNCYLLTKPLKLSSADTSVRSLPGASQGLTTPSEAWAKPLQCHLRVCEKCGRSRPSLDWARICSLMRSQCDLCAHQS